LASSLPFGLFIRKSSTGKTTTLYPTTLGTEPCQTTFNNWLSYPIAVPEDPNNSSALFGFLIGPSNLAATKDGAYTLTLKDEIGQTFTYTVYVNNGNPPVCPSPTPSPEPSPTPAPPGGGGGKGGNGGGNTKDPGGPDLDEPNDEECPCQQNGFGIQTSEGPSCPSECSQEAKIKSKPCSLKAYDPKTRQQIKPPIEGMKVQFRGAYDFDRRKVNSKNEPVNTRDIELVFVTEKAFETRGQQTIHYLSSDKFLKQITINNRRDLVNDSGPENQLPDTNDYKYKLRNDYITDAIYNNNQLIAEAPAYGYGDIFGFPKKIQAHGSLLMVSANLSKLPRQEQVISIQMPSADRKILFETRLKLTPAASTSNKNWEEITCVD